MVLYSELELEKKQAEDKRRERERLDSKTQLFLQKKQEEIKNQYMEFAAFSLEFAGEGLKPEPMPVSTAYSLC